MMSYAPGVRVLQFSNPNVSYEGFSTGSSDANNAQSLNDTSSVIAAFREEVSSTPYPNGSEVGTPTPSPSPSESGSGGGGSGSGSSGSGGGESGLPSKMTYYSGLAENVEEFFSSETKRYKSHGCYRSDGSFAVLVTNSSILTTGSILRLFEDPASKKRNLRRSIRRLKQNRSTNLKKIRRKRKMLRSINLGMELCGFS